MDTVKHETDPCDLIQRLEGTITELGEDLINFQREYGPRLKSGHLPKYALEQWSSIREHFCRIAVCVVAIEKTIKAGRKKS
jgi:hypothetical protein